MGSKPIRSCVTRPKHLFPVLCHRKFMWIGEYFMHKWRYVPCVMTSSTIPPLSILNIWIRRGLTALELEWTHPGAKVALMPCTMRPQNVIETRHFRVVVVQWRQTKVQKSEMHLQSSCFSNLNLLLFCRSRWRRHRSIGRCSIEKETNALSGFSPAS